MAYPAERYLCEYVDMHNEPATAAHYRIMLCKHVLSLQLGLRDKPMVANHGVEMQVKMFNLVH